MTKRLIESTFPIQQVGREATREKRIRKGHISTMFRWWARRPLASSRATNFAALIPRPQSPSAERELNQFIVELSKWKNATNHELLEQARRMILKAFNGRPPVVLDPFSGGGAIPLEALRLGCETHATDYNPVAVLLLKCTLDYPQRFGQQLLAELKSWGSYVFERVHEELASLHLSMDASEKRESPQQHQAAPRSRASEERTVFGYLWAWSIRCANPRCHLQIPLFKHYWLAKKDSRRVFLHPHVNAQNKQVTFKIEQVDDNFNPRKSTFNPNQGTVSRANVTCPSCNSVIPAKQVRHLFLEKKATPLLIAVVERDARTRNKRYRIATDHDLKQFHRAEMMLREKLEHFQETWGFYPLPREPLPPKDTLGFRVQRYGMLEWQDLFNARQKLFFVVAMHVLLEVKNRLLKVSRPRNRENELNEAIVSYLAMLMVDLTRYNNILNRWVPESESLAEVFGRQAFSMIWNHFENNPLGSHGGTWNRRLTTLINVLEQLSMMKRSAASIRRANATSLPFDDNTFDAVFTDPPYYDNVPYSYLSDFFYVWLKRLLDDIHPQLFFTPTVPKKHDLVAYSHDSSFKEAKETFERELTQAFKEIHRVLKPNGIGIILYAHKTTAGWEAVINALLQSNLSITAVWPIATEQRGRLRARESAALATTTYIIVRKLKKKKLGMYAEVRQSLEQLLREKLRALWEEGISGADFFIAAIGGGLEAYGSYEQVIDHSGRVITAAHILEDIRQVALRITMARIFKSEILRKITPSTQFYVTWRMYFQDKEVPFDEAKKLAQSLGISLERSWNHVSFLQKKKDKVKVLGPQERQLTEKLISKVRNSPKELIDLLHVLILSRESGNRSLHDELMEQVKNERETLLTLAQAIAGTLPIENKERRMLEHFIASIQSIHGG